MSKNYLFAGIVIAGMISVLSFLAVFLWGSPTQGILIRIIFNLTIFVFIVSLVFLISFLLQMFFVRILKKGDFILRDEWVHFRRGVFIGLSVILLSYLNRANLFHWMETLFIIILFFGLEFIYSKSKKSPVIND
jgi:hypothetical protein